MNTQPKKLANVPDFDFGDDAQDKSDGRRTEIEQTRAAFKKAGYFPPEESKQRGALPDESTANLQRENKERPAKETPPSVSLTTWRRSPGRPAGDRQHRISIKTTEKHLAFMYSIADGRKLVVAFERAIEALAREALGSGVYQERNITEETRVRAQALIEDR